jgi:methylated-DNA-[protein]-cysteine S-methyltransferase
MDYIATADTPLGEALLASDGRALTGLWFRGQKHKGAGLSPEAEARELPVFAEARRWLASYFSGREPDFTPPLAPRGSAFQKRVWDRLRRIPWGQTLSYGDLARELGCASARAVGQAVGRNPISLLIPCHRVLGAGSRLTGYAGGLWRKEALLHLEGALPGKEEQTCS